MWGLMGMAMVQHAALRRCRAWFWRTIGPFRISGQPSASPATSRITRLTDSRVLGRSFSNWARHLSILDGSATKCTLCSGLSINAHLLGEKVLWYIVVYSKEGTSRNNVDKYSDPHSTGAKT